MMELAGSGLCAGLGTAAGCDRVTSVPPTFKLPQQVRKVMNALDNERESRATDMLLNYETVKYFCNERYELASYDRATRQYQVRLFK